MAKPSVATVKIREEVAALKRERTLGAAVDLFYAKGYENTTLDEVADRLGMTKPFVYANFGSKAELLAEICLRGVLAASQALDAVLARRKGPRESLEAFARDYVTAVLGVQKHIAVYVREEKNLDSSDARRLGEMRREFFGKMTKLLERGVATGEFEIDDAGLAALGIGGAVTWSAFWFRPDGRLSSEEIAETMTKLLLGMAGACAQPRRARA
ncbi:MAG: TetR family transcriptional regulator [Pseudomonadota bacterium]|nr:TetR family transcriptional regulator [Pseudomonadota bacterium]